MENATLSLEETRVTGSAQFTGMLTDLQANILKHHGRDTAYHIFVSINPNEVDAAKNWISAFAYAKVTAAAKQLVDAKMKNEKDVDGGTIYTLSLSASGYDKLQLGNVKPLDVSFNAGMRKSSTRLSDTPDLWESEFQNQVDMLVIVANADAAKALLHVEELLTQMAKAFTLIKLQKGTILKNENEIGIEHFGYADGISQPMFLKKEVINQSGTLPLTWDDEARLKLALVKDPGGSTDDSFGSYLVFRKLEQNVKAFKNAEEKLPSILPEGAKPRKELPGAMVVGRFEDGTEVTNFAKENGITKPAQLNNNFDYNNDKQASKCPFHSHIRITNPRADIGNTDIDSFVKKVRLVRRGIPYDDIPGGRKSLDDQPTEEVGLLFMCYQSDIANQFEFIQSDWANRGDIGGNEVGQDGIIGQGENTDEKTLPAEWNVTDPGSVQKCDFSNPNGKFVTMKGGEYFFTPSISFLRTMAEDFL